MGYEPGNVRWATMGQQSNNKRTNRRVSAQGETKTLTEWARETGLSKSGMGGRISKGADVLAPVRKLGSEPLTPATYSARLDRRKNTHTTITGL